MNIGEISRVSGVSIRALRHYDSIGLLRPHGTTEAGYRQYDEETLKRLYTILLFRELGVPLKEIRSILDSADFDPVAVLERQIALLEDKRQHIDNLILLARGVKVMGLNHMSFTAFDAQTLDEKVSRLPDDWQNTPEMREFEQKDAHRTDEERKAVEQSFEALMTTFGEHPDDPASPEAQAMVQRLRDFISEHFYACNETMLRYLANYYDGGGEFTQNIDGLAGQGTAAFLAAAMRIYAESRAESRA